MIKTTIGQFANSIGLNKDDYIPKEGVSISLFKVEILSGLTVALALSSRGYRICFCCRCCTFIRFVCSFYSWFNYSCIRRAPRYDIWCYRALAVVMVALVADHGAQYLFATVVLMGILQLIAGIFKLREIYKNGSSACNVGFC